MRGLRFEKDSSKLEIVLPIMWVETATQSLVNRFKEIALGLERELERCTPEQKLERALGEIRKSAVPLMFQHHKFDPNIKARLDDINKKRLDRPWTYDHIVGGTEGCYMEESKMQEPLHNDAMCRLFGLASMLQASGKQ